MADEELLNDSQKDDLFDVEKVFSEYAAEALSTLLSREAKVTIEKIGQASPAEIEVDYADGCVVVELDFEGGTEGKIVFLLQKDTTSKIADLMTSGDGSAEFSEEHLGPIQEATDQIMGAASTGISSQLKEKIEFLPSQAKLVDSENLGIEISDFVSIDLSIKIKDTPNDFVIKLISKEGCYGLLEGWNPSQTDEAAVQPTDEETIDLKMDEATLQLTDEEMADVRKEQQDAPVTKEEKETEPVVVRRAQFEQLAPEAVSGDDTNIDVIIDLPLTVSIELGRKKMLVREFLTLGTGYVVELDKLAGEPVDLLVNDRKFAEGEVVIVAENFGVRITNLVSSSSKLEKSLGSL